MKRTAIIFICLWGVAFGQSPSSAYLKIGGTSRIDTTTATGLATLHQNSLKANSTELISKQDSLNWYTPETYGALGDGSTDDAAAFTAMILAMPAKGGKVHLSKEYSIESTVTINKPVHFYGNGSTMNDITPNFTTAIRAGVADIVLFRIVESHCSFKDLILVSSFGNVAGTAIRVDSNLRAPSAPVKRFNLDNVNIYGFWNGVEATGSYLWSIRNCLIQIRNIGVTVANLTAPDAGDSYITGCNFEPNGGAMVAAIWQTNSGGLRITNNKFNFNGSSKYQYAYRGILSGTSDLIFSNNSIENYSISAIYLTGPSTKFSNIIITGNQFSALTAGTRPDIMMDSATALTIMGNVFTKSVNNDTAILLGQVTYANVSNAYSGYGVPTYYTGTSTSNTGDGTGAVLTSFTATQASAIPSPQNGRIIYVTSTDGTFTSVGGWIRENGVWVKL